MFPFWDLVIAPVLDAVDAQTGRGDRRARGRDHHADARPARPRRRAPRHRPGAGVRPDRARASVPRPLHLPPGPQPRRAAAPSPPMDAALIDGDHNWYTVYHELRMLADIAAASGRTPAGPRSCTTCAGRTAGATSTTRRSASPRSSASPTRSAACGWAGSGCCRGGGLNPTMYNAVTEGGPRNGVDDRARRLHGRVRPAAAPSRAARSTSASPSWWRKSASPTQPELAGSSTGSRAARAARRCSSSPRTSGSRRWSSSTTSSSAASSSSNGRATAYLELLKGALLDEHYLENELRIDYLAECVERGSEPRSSVLRDPRTPQAELRTAPCGASSRHGAGEPRRRARGPTSRTPRWAGSASTTSKRCLETDPHASRDGDLVECGTGRGGGAIFLRGFLEAHEVDDAGSGSRTASVRRRPATVGTRASGGGRHGCRRSQCGARRLRPLRPPRRSCPVPAGPAVAHAARRRRSRRSRCCGSVAIWTARSTIARRALRQGRHRWIRRRRRHGDPSRPRGGREVPRAAAHRRADRAHRRLRCVLAEDRPRPARPARASARQSVPTVEPRARSRRRSAGTARTSRSSSSSTTCGARRSARSTRCRARTSRASTTSTTRSSQSRTGPTTTQKLGEEFVRSFGPEFRYLDLGADATPSPVHALNRGIARGRR